MNTYRILALSAWVGLSGLVSCASSNDARWREPDPGVGEVGSGGQSSALDGRASGGRATATGGGEMGDGGEPEGSGAATQSGGSSAMGGLGSGGGTFTADCETLATDPNIGWRESSLTTDQEIVACLAATLGRPVGFGEQALGGYDPGGGSRLVVIEKRDDVSVEEQLLLAIAGDEHAWIVFDKEDFADDTNIGLYRAFCDDAAVQSALAGSAEECLDHGKWCASRGYDEEAECLDRFFNGALNDGDLPIRNPVIGSNKTIDGRLSNAHFLFSGFAIGSDSSGSPVNTSSSVILTHLSFRGAGHTEDHELDPDMIRSTGASHDIWIHKNDFVLTGDSAFDVKVGAYDITMSFNRVVDVLRATLHGSSDSREINEQITTTMHHNAFVSHDERYMDLGNTGRRVPLLRRGTSHMWNNAFFNYRKDIVSVRVAGSLLWENNALLVNESLAEKSSIEASLDELASNLVRDISDGNFRAEGTRLWFADATCAIQAGTERSIAPSSGSVDDLVVQYGDASRAIIESEMRPAGQGLVDYISKTAGKTGEAPFNSPLARSQTEVLMDPRMSCQD